MKRLVAWLLAMCMVCSVAVAAGEMPAWPFDGLVLGTTGVKVVLPDDIPVLELTEENRQAGVVGMASKITEDGAGGFVLIVLEETEIPEDLHAQLMTEMKSTAVEAGLQVAEEYDRWMMTVMAQGDALYARKGRTLVGETEVYFVQGTTYKGSKFLYAGVQDGEKVYWLLYSMNAEYAESMPDVLALTLWPVEQ